MKITDNLALTFKVGDMDVYHTPLSREAFEASYRLIAATKAVLFDTTDQSLVMDGHILALLTLKDEGARLAAKRGEEGDGGAEALIKELTRLTMVFAPDMELTPVSSAGIDPDEWQEALSDLVFFTVIYALARKAEKRQRAASAAAMLDFSITSLSPEEWTRSLKTLTKPETTAKKAASSVPV